MPTPLLPEDEDIEYYSLTLAAESRGEPRAFQLAVGEVIMRRYELARRGRAWRRAKSIKDIVLWPQQFSCWNDNDPNRKWIESAMTGKLSGLDYLALKQCRWIAQGFLEGHWRRELAMADHYHTLPLGKHPRWSNYKKLIGRVEARLATGWFYRLIED